MGGAGGKILWERATCETGWWGIWGVGGGKGEGGEGRASDIGIGTGSAKSGDDLRTVEGVLLHLRYNARSSRNQALAKIG